MLYWLISFFPSWFYGVYHSRKNGDSLDKKLTFFLKCNPPLRFPAFFTKKTLIGRVVSWCKKIKTNAYKLVKMPAIAPENVEKDKKSQYKWTKYTISNGDFI
jgi:hypothetical protein